MIETRGRLDLPSIKPSAGFPSIWRVAFIGFRGPDGTGTALVGRVGQGRVVQRYRPFLRDLTEAAAISLQPAAK